jgi:hypothetical protein
VVVYLLVESFLGFYPKYLERAQFSEFPWVVHTLGQTDLACVLLLPLVLSATASGVKFLVGAIFP